MFFKYPEAKTGKDLRRVLTSHFREYYLTIHDDSEMVRLVKYVKSKWKKKMMNAINSIPANMKVLKPGETDMDLDMPTLWLETSDAFEMAADGDYSGIDDVLQEIYYWIKKKKYIRK